MSVCSAAAGGGRREAAALTAVCCSVSRAPRLLVATSAGVLYVYALDAAEGGECALLRQHVFLEPAQAAHAHAHAPGAQQAQSEGNPRTPSRAD